jgi:uncharacterized protein (DUF885 family)
MERELEAKDGLSCQAYLAWNNEPVSDVVLWMAGTGTGSVAFIPEDTQPLLRSRPAAFITFDKPGVHASFGDPASVRIDDAPLQRHTQETLLECAKQALRLTEDTFGARIRWHFRGHSEGVSIGLTLLLSLLAEHPEQAQRVATLVLSGVPLESLPEIFRRQLADKPLLARAVQTCNWPIMKQQFGLSCGYLQEAQTRPSGFALFEKLSALHPHTRFEIFQGNADLNTPVSFVHQLDAWNREHASLDLNVHYYDGAHAGTSEARRQLAALMLGLVPVAKPALEDSAHRVQRVAEEYSAAYLQTFPDLAEYVGQTLPHHDELPDHSLAALQVWQAREDAWLAALASIDGEQLWGKPEWVLYGSLRNALENSVGTRVCRAELWPAHQYGWQTTFLAIIDQQPLGTALARAEALSRWAALPRFLDTEVDNLREGLRLGYTAPRRNIELAIAQLDALLAPAPSESPLSGPAKRDTDPDFRARWRRLVETEMLPAVVRYRDFLRAEYAPRTRTTLGIAGIPHGAECYRAQLKAHTTQEVAPRELYELGQRQVAEREAKALRLARAVFGSGINDLRAAKVAVDAEPRNHFRSADEALAFTSQALTRAQQAAPRWFVRVPRSPLTLVPYDDFEAKAHPDARYEPAAQDGSHPARFRIDTTNFGSLQRIGVEHTAFHEGIPGHHLQLGRESASPGQQQVPDFGGLSAYIEGWARYGESLADEMGLYSSDLDRFGAASLLPTGLVVDPGIHAMGWTRENAAAWVTSKQIGFSPEEVEAYLDRIAVCPGEMVSYGFGEREFIALRHEAELALGPKFDIKAFHERVLAHGALPLPLLRAIITRWIRDGG